MALEFEGAEIMRVGAMGEDDFAKAHVSAWFKDEADGVTREITIELPVKYSADQTMGEVRRQAWTEALRVLRAALARLSEDRPPPIGG